MQSEAKKGSVTGYSLSPLSRREGRKRNKSFPLQGGRQSDTSVTTWAQLITCPSLQGKTCVSFPSLPNAEAREAAIRHRSLFWDYIPKCLCKIRPLPQPYPRHPHLSEGPLLSCCLGFDKYQYHWGQDSQTHLICMEKGYRPRGTDLLWVASAVLTTHLDPVWQNFQIHIISCHLRAVFRWGWI